MLSLSDAQLEPLQQAFRDVAFRSNRLGEWIDLEPYLRNLESSFNLFYDEVKAAVGPPLKLTQGRIKRIQELWNRCRSTDFTDLRSFALGAIHLSQPLPSGAGGNPGPQIGVWITDLVQSSDQIQEALTNKNYNDLAQNAQKFQQTLYGQIADRRNLVRREVRELCDLTILLKNNLGA